MNDFTFATARFVGSTAAWSEIDAEVDRIARIPNHLLSEREAWAVTLAELRRQHYCQATDVARGVDVYTIGGYLYYASVVVGEATAALSIPPTHPRERLLAAERVRARPAPEHPEPEAKPKPYQMYRRSRTT